MLSHVYKVATTDIMKAPADMNSMAGPLHTELFCLCSAVTSKIIDSIKNKVMAPITIDPINNKICAYLLMTASFLLIFDHIILYDVS